MKCKKAVTVILPFKEGPRSEIQATQVLSCQMISGSNLSFPLHASLSFVFLFVLWFML